jgi:hypothetical protein
MATERAPKVSPVVEEKVIKPIRLGLPPADHKRLEKCARERGLNNASYARMAVLMQIEADEVELLNGIVVRKMPERPRHDASFTRCRRRIEPVLPAGWYLRLEGAVRIPDYDEPEQDLSVIRGDGDDYTDHHPGPRDVA